MLCPLCQSANPDVAARCRACGAALGGAKSSDTSSPDALPDGTLLAGAYAVEGVLGQGGFGITYRCHDQMLDRPVAVKEFFPAGCRREQSDVQPSRALSASNYRDARAQFLAEARLLARCRHVGIVGVHAAFEANQTAYMVMELLHGQSLGQLLTARGGRMNEADAVPIIGHIGEALGFVHDLDLLHRDIKPDNIMVCDDGRVMLIDFGTAREFVKDAAQGHTVVVTPGYAPLEQYAKQAKRGAFTDIYSLAATLYQMLTGQMPPAASDRAMGVQLRPVREENPQISASVARAVESGLQMEIARRPQSVSEFLGLLSAPVPETGVANNSASFSAEDLPLSDVLIYSQSLQARRASQEGAPSAGDATDALGGSHPGAMLHRIYSDALQARQQLLDDAQSGSNAPHDSDEPDEANGEVPAVLTPDAIRARQSVNRPLALHSVQLAPPRAFSTTAKPPEPPSVWRSASGNVNVNGDPDSVLDVKVAGIILTLFIALVGLALLFGSNKANVSSYSPPQRNSSAIYLPPFTPASNANQDDQKRDKAQREWDALPILLPTSDTILPGSEVTDLPKATDSAQSYRVSQVAIKFSPDGKRMAYVGNDAKLRALSLPDRREVRSIQLDETLAAASAMFSPNNKLIAVSQIKVGINNSPVSASSVELWSLQSGKKLGTYNHDSMSNQVWIMAVSDDGRVLIRTSSGSEGIRDVFWWNSKDGERSKAPFDAPEISQWGYGVLSPDGQEFVLGERNNRLRWLDAQTGKQKFERTMNGVDANYKALFGSDLTQNQQNLGVRGIDYSLNGAYLASRSAAEISVFNNAEAKQFASLTIDGTSAMDFSMSPDGNWLAARGALPFSPDGTLLWNVRTNQKIRLQAPYEYLRDFGFSLDGKQLYGIFADAKASHFVTWNVDAKAAQISRTFAQVSRYSFDSPRENGKPEMFLSPSAQRIAFVKDSSIDIYSGKSYSKTLDVPDAVAATFSRDDKLLAVRQFDDAIQLRDVVGGKLLGQLEKPDAASGQEANSRAIEKRARTLAFSPDNKLLAYAHSKNNADVIELWNVEGTPRRLGSLAQQELVSVLIFSPDGKNLICGGENGLLQWYDVASRQLKTRLKRGEPIFDLAFGARTLVVMGSSNSVTYAVPANAASPLRKAVATELPQSFNSGRDIFTPATISPDGKLLATAQGYNKFQIWELPSGRLLQEISQPRGTPSLTTSAFSFAADSQEFSALGQRFGDEEVFVTKYRRAKAK